MMDENEGIPLTKHKNPKKRGMISACGVIVRVSILIIALLVSSVAITSYETRTIEPRANWDIIVDSYDWEIDYWDDIEFYNATEGWIVGRGDVGTEFENRSNGIVMHTSNGGADWDLVFSDKDMSSWHRDIQIVDVDTIWLATDEGLLHTEDRGVSWEYSPATRYSDAVQFRNSSYGLASINKGMRYTNDSGNSWYDLDTWSFEESLYEINFVADDVIWACGYSGIYRSSDGGSSWYRQRNRKASAMSVLNESEAWALGWGLGIAHCTDGVAWSEDMIVSGWRDTYDSYRDMEFLDENNGWLVGSGLNSLAYTPDGGANWYSQSLTRDLIAIDFVNETHGWAAGWHGVIARTTTGNQFGSKLIIDGIEIPFGMGVSRPRVPQTFVSVNIILLIVIPVLFMAERAVVGIRRNKIEGGPLKRRDRVFVGSIVLFFVAGGISGGLLLGGDRSPIAYFFIFLSILAFVLIFGYVCYLIYDYPNEQLREARRQIRMEQSRVHMSETFEPSKDEEVEIE